MIRPIEMIRLPKYLSLVLSFSLLATLATAEEFPFVGKATSEDVNIRAGQSASFEKVGRLRSGDPVVVVTKDYGWYKVKLPIDSRCYIHSKFIKEIDDKTGEVTADRVNIRAGSGEQFPILGQANKGQYVRIVEKMDSWYKIEPTDETFGWVTEEFLKFETKDVPPQRLVTPTTRNIYERKRLAAEQGKTEPAPMISLPVEASAPAPAAKALVPLPKPDVFVTGKIADLAERSIAKDVRHIVSDDNNSSVYYLKGPQNVMDIFLNREVVVEGVTQSGITAPYPVVQIQKINLVL